MASTCGRWLVMATSRSCAAGSMATGRAPSEVTKAWASRNRSAWVVGDRGEEPRRVVEDLRRRAGGAARLGAADRDDRRRSARRSPAAAQTAPLVEPTSMTVHPSGARSSTARTIQEARPPALRPRPAGDPRAPGRASLPQCTRRALLRRASVSASSIPAGHLDRPGALGGEPDGGADEPGADDCERRDHLTSVMIGASRCITPASTRR